MNTCIKCGCQDAYPSLPPCPVPAACPNPQPCAEVFSSACIILELPDIMCGEDIVVIEDSSIPEALSSIITYFCEQVSLLKLDINSINLQITTINQDIIDIFNNLQGTVQSVTGLNTDNTDPQNPIVRISVDGTTITGLGTPASPLVANNINLQKEITTSNYVLTNVDNNYTIFINNGVTAISISLGAITVPNFCVGFIQEGSADVTFVGVTNPVGLKSKGQGYQTFIERKLSTATYYLLGNTKV